MAIEETTWMGKLPEAWDTCPLKYAFAIEKRIAGREGYTVLSITQSGIKPKNMSVQGQFAQDYSKYQLVHPGDFAMNHMDLLTGWVDISKHEGVTSPDYRVFTNRNPAKFVSEFYKYLFQYCYSARVFYGMGQGVSGVGRWRLPAEMFLNFKLPVPNAEEQKAIVAYLDQQIADVDSIIAEAKASIEEYKVWRASIIYEAVTKGLDPNVEMKDSGVEWIGEIPDDWKVCKTLYALSMPVTDGPHTTPELYDDGIPFVSAEAVSCGKGKIAFDHIRGYISEAFYNECCLKYIPQKNDIYMIKSGATTGRVSYVDTDIKFTIRPPLAVFRCNENRMYFKYLFYFLQSDAYQKQVQLGWTYGTQQNIGMRTLETLKVCLPPIDVQQKIATHLDQKCGTIDGLIEEKELLISDLEAYKKSLIFEVVTGKRRVC